MCLIAEAFVFIAVAASVVNRMNLEVKKADSSCFIFLLEYLPFSFCIISFPNKYSWIKPEPLFAGFLK